MMKNNIPDIRFTKFKGYWEIRMLKSISNKVTQKNKDSKFKETLTNSAEYGIISQRDFFDKDISNEKNLNGYFVVNNDDFVYNPRISKFAPVGPIKRNKLNRTGVMSPLYFVFRTYDIDKEFLEFYFESTKWHRFLKLNGDSGARSDRFAIKDSIFIEMPIPYPSVEEQKQISSFLLHLDEIIKLQQLELNNLKQMKQGFLQKMFPKEGETVPEIRFPGFTDDWEQRKLGELMEITSVKRIHQSDWTDSGVRFLRARDIVSAFKGEELADYLYISQEKYDEYSKLSGKVKIGDLLVTGVGSIGVPMLVNTEEPLYFKDGNIIWFRNETIHGDFFYYAFTAKTIQKYIKDVAGIGTVGTYTIDSGKKTPIYLPSWDEQVKVGQFFTAISDLITLHQQELDLLKQTKKAFLQKMFI